MTLFRSPPMEAFLQSLDIPESEWANPGLDLSCTPSRIEKMMREELLSSYKPGALEDLISRFTVFDSDGMDAMVTFSPIAFHSTCSHHWLPFSGNAHVAYIPRAKLVGASKIPRVVNFYSKMLQIQERMTRQIAEFIYEQAGASMVVVLLEASHTCTGCRGVKQPGMKMVTTAIRPAPGGEGDSLLRGVLDEFYLQTAPFRGR